MRFLLTLVNIAAWGLLLLLVAGCDDVQVPPGRSGQVGPEMELVWSGAWDKVFTFCDRGHRIYLHTTYRGGGVAVVPNGCQP